MRQTRHVSSLNSFPEPGAVRQPHHVASHSAFVARSVLLGVGEAVVHVHTEPLDRIVEGDDPEECGRHVMCPRSTPFPSQERCGSHIVWPRTRPFPVFAPNRRRIFVAEVTVTIMVRYRFQKSSRAGI